MEKIKAILKRLADIADAYDKNNLDTPARRLWGTELQHENKTPATEIEIYSGRGGRSFLTLQDCFDAREALKLIT